MKKFPVSRLFRVPRDVFGILRRIFQQIPNGISPGGSQSSAYSQSRRTFREVFAAIFGKSAQLPARALKAFSRRTEGFTSETMNPAAVFDSFTVLDLTQKSYGKRMAWKRPESKTLAVTAFIACSLRQGDRYPKPR
jgi:hypothetical protein